MLDPSRMDDVLRRGGGVGEAVAAWKIVDERRRLLQGELDTLRAARNAANDRMAKLDKKGAEFAAARDELKELSTKIKTGEAELTAVEEQSRDRLMQIPNAPHASVPVGTSEHDNVPLHTWGTKPAFDFAPKSHWEVGERLGILDFEAGGRISGARFGGGKAGGERVAVTANFGQFCGKCIGLPHAFGQAGQLDRHLLDRRLVGIGTLAPFRNGARANKPAERKACQQRHPGGDQNIHGWPPVVSERTENLQAGVHTIKPRDGSFPAS